VRVIGTAGHVDHGKSSLVHALTGIDPDRLREEKEREMTIDLGFAWLTLPGGEPVGIVDVPGHRDFIENMLAGVGGIDAALFVVAADEGVMPQTREHLAILDLLEVDSGVVALTKIDLAEDEEWLELVTAEVVELLEGTRLSDAPVVPVSVRTGVGLDQLLITLEGVLAASQPRRDRGRPRLPVDRVFTISGFGTVVTGTLIDGSLSIGQEVEIQPQGLKARIRGLQTHKQKIEQAVPGSRVAVNLSGVRKEDLQRGDVVTTPGWLRNTVLVDAQLEYLADNSRPLRHNQQIKFFSGAAEVLARVRLLGDETLLPGQSGWAQLRLSHPLALAKGDRFILRLPSPAMTIGGGVVIDPYPGRRHRRFRPEIIQRLQTLAQGTPAEIALQTLERRGPMSGRELAQASGLGEETGEALRELVTSGQVVILDGAPGEGAIQAGYLPSKQGGAGGRDQLFTSRSSWSALTEQIERELRSYHDAYPLRPGMPREALRGRLRLQARLFNAVVLRATAEERVVDEGATVRLSTHAVRFSPAQQRQVDTLLEQFRANPYSPPSVKESLAKLGDELLAALLAQHKLVQVSDGVIFLAATYDEMVERSRAYIQANGSITVAQFRDLFGTSRKYALGLLEYLDGEGITRRVGDKRVLR
jgi:selenocysteine-specific elongation factor